MKLFKAKEPIVKITAIFLIIAAVSLFFGFRGFESVVTRCVRDGEALIGCGSLKINKLFWPYFWFHNKRHLYPHWRNKDDTLFTYKASVGDIPDFMDYRLWLILLFSVSYWLVLSILIYKLVGAVFRRLRKKSNGID